MLYKEEGLLEVISLPSGMGMTAITGLADWDASLGLRHGSELLPVWTAVEDDKALYLFCDMTGTHKPSVMESIREMKFITGIHEKDVKDYFPNNETVRKRDLSPIQDLMRGVKSEPCEYYYHVMQDAEELDDIVGSMAYYMLGMTITNSTRMEGVVQFKANVYVSGVDYNPQAVYIIVGLGTPDTREFYVGYAIEIFPDDSSYNAIDVVRDNTNAFSPCHSPTGNLARLLNVAEHRIGFRPCKLPRWQVVEDDKALYLIRAMTGLREEYAKTFAINEGFMSEKCEKDVEESLTKRN
ncbi:hypothetical protein Tco_0572292 [Tanacetum coccineum]